MICVLVKVFNKVMCLQQINRCSETIIDVIMYTVYNTNFLRLLCVVATYHFVRFQFHFISHSALFLCILLVVLPLFVWYDERSCILSNIIMIKLNGLASPSQRRIEIFHCSTAVCFSLHLTLLARNMPTCVKNGSNKFKTV